MMKVVLTPRPVSVYSLFHMKQRDADKVDLWLTNSFLLPLTVLNVSLPPRLQGAMKVRTKFTQHIYKAMVLKLVSKRYYRFA